MRITDDRPTTEDETLQKKKAYQPPTLKLYGSVQELTKVVNVTSTHFDGGSAGMNKTH